MQYPKRIFRSNKCDHHNGCGGNLVEQIYEWTLVKEYKYHCLYVSNYSYKTCFLKHDLENLMKNGKIKWE